MAWRTTSCAVFQHVHLMRQHVPGASVGHKTDRQDAHQSETTEYIKLITP